MEKIAEDRIKASTSDKYVGEKDKIRVGVYLRVSSRAGLDQDVERQRYGIQKHLDANPHKQLWHEEKAQYVDYASGGGWARKELNRVVADFKRHYLDEIIFFEVDRLGRDTRESLNYIDSVRKIGGTIYVCDDDTYAGEDSAGWERMQLKIMFAEWELKKIISRTCSGNERKKAALAEEAKILGYDYLRTGSPGIIEKWITDPLGAKKGKEGLVVAPDSGRQRKFREFWRAGVEIIDLQTEFPNPVSPTCEFWRLNAAGRVVKRKGATGKQHCKCNKPVTAKTISLTRRKLDLTKRHPGAWGHKKGTGAPIFGIKFTTS